MTLTGKGIGREVQDDDYDDCEQVLQLLFRGEQQQLVQFYDFYEFSNV